MMTNSELKIALNGRRIERERLGHFGRCEELRKFLITQKHLRKMSDEEIKTRWLAAAKIK